MMKRLLGLLWTGMVMAVPTLPSLAAEPAKATHAVITAALSTATD